LQEVHQEYLGFLTEDVLEPLKKIQSSLDQLAKLSGDAEKERKKALAGAREAADTIEAKLKVLAQFAKEASEAAEGSGEASAIQLTEHLKGIRRGSER
jgi:hypothetical protein